MAESSETAATASAEKKESDQVGKNIRYTKEGNPDLKSLTGRETEFEELGDFTSLYDGLATHARQHVNPLASELQVPTKAPDWKDFFADPSLPLQIDVGCGSGRFVLIRGKRMAGHVPKGEASTDSTAAEPKVKANVLGMEIRQKLVQRAEEWSKRLELKNCRFIFTNATVSWKSLLASYPGPIELVSMQFPDPHFKKKHFKRRHVQPQLVKEIAETMPSGSQVFLQGDVPEVVRWMRDMFERHGDGKFTLAPDCVGKEGLFRTDWESPMSEKELTDEAGKADDGDDEDDAGEDKPDKPAKRKRIAREIAAEPLQKATDPLKWSGDENAGWMPENPLGVPTEREVYVKQTNAPVYRVMLLRV